MKDSLIQLLMDFFTKSLSQLNDGKASKVSSDENSDEHLSLDKANMLVNLAKETSIRVFTEDEKSKLTKASYQLLTRLLLWGVIAPESMELVINQLLFSESRFVTLEETKWTIRNVLAENLSAEQYAFLDLVLYQKEDKLPFH